MPSSISTNAHIIAGILKLPTITKYKRVCWLRDLRMVCHKNVRLLTAQQIKWYIALCLGTVSSMTKGDHMIRNLITSNGMIELWLDTFE